MTEIKKKNLFSTIAHSKEGREAASLIGITPSDQDGKENVPANDPPAIGTIKNGDITSGKNVISSDKIDQTGQDNEGEKKKPGVGEGEPNVAAGEKNQDKSRGQVKPATKPGPAKGKNNKLEVIESAGKAPTTTVSVSQHIITRSKLAIIHYNFDGNLRDLTDTALEYYLENVLEKRKKGF